MNQTVTSCHCFLIMEKDESEVGKQLPLLVTSDRQNDNAALGVSMYKFPSPNNVQFIETLRSDFYKKYVCRLFFVDGIQFILFLDTNTRIRASIDNIMIVT